MPRPPLPVHLGVKRLLLFTLTLLACSSLLAIELDPKLDRAVREAAPVCNGLEITYEASPVKLPPRFTGALVTMKSPSGACDGALVAVLSPTGGFYLGAPWLIENEEGTIEQKLKAFAWRNMQENVSVAIDPAKRTDDGLFPTTLQQITEHGNMPIQGELDPQGRIFFFGHFRRLASDLRAQRAKAFDSFMTGLPAKGASASKITVVEFSDFQCPSCKRSSGYAEALLAKHGDKIRYVRFDLPLTMHAWAFPAALAGRAIHRQNPELFWEYKKQVYANQEKLSAFLFWDWARGWAEDHDLDMKTYDADLQSADLKNEILRGAGAAFANDVRATPTFMINGAMVEAGEEGKALDAYIESLLK